MDDTAEPDGRWFLVLIAGALVLSVGIAFFLDGGQGDVEDLEREIVRLEEEIDDLEKRHEEIKRRRIRLQNDPNLIESLARDRLGYSRPGERQVRFPNLMPMEPLPEQSGDRSPVAPTGDDDR